MSRSERRFLSVALADHLNCAQVGSLGRKRIDSESRWHGPSYSDSCSIISDNCFSFSRGERRRRRAPPRYLRISRRSLLKRYLSAPKPNRPPLINMIAAVQGFSSAKNKKPKRKQNNEKRHAQVAKNNPLGEVFCASGVLSNMSEPTTKTEKRKTH